MTSWQGGGVVAVRQEVALTQALLGLDGVTVGQEEEYLSGSKKMFFSGVGGVLPLGAASPLWEKIGGLRWGHVCRWRLMII